jgi:hypothetical protein
MRRHTERPGRAGGPERSQPGGGAGRGIEVNAGDSEPEAAGGARIAIVSVLAHARPLVLTATWAVLMVVWLATCAELGLRAGAWHHAALAAGDVLLLGVLYLAEGMELAVTDLLDKDPEQVVSPVARGMLRAIQGRSGFFFANRQVFVVVVIAFMSLTTAYPWVFVPGVGEVTSSVMRFWFGFLLTTLTVLWFAQVTPKRLAIVNSELFLEQCRPIWPLIRLIGIVGLPTPTDLIVAAVVRHSQYRRRRLLLPSKAVNYSVQARLYGYSMDRLCTSILLGRDGRQTIRKRFLVLLLHGPHWQTYGSIESPVPLSSPPRVKVAGLFLAEVPEQLERIAPDLDEIFEAAGPGPASRFESIPLADWHHEVETSQYVESLDGRSTAYWMIHGESLPETYQRTEGAEPEAPPTMIALLYEVEAAYTAAEPAAGESSWSEVVQLPCRLLTIEAAGRRGSAVAIVPMGVRATLSQSRTELDEETRRLSRQVVANRGVVRIPYPLVGTTYTLSWRRLRSRRSDAR